MIVTYSLRCSSYTKRIHFTISLAPNRFLMKQLLLSLFFLLNVLVTHATVLTGIITETNGKQLPFVNVFIKGSTTGTSANSEGKYALDLTPGAHTIVFKIIGYRQIEKQVVIAAATYTLNVIMQTEQYELKEATVTAGEDP